MPHQCTTCGEVFEDGSKEMLAGCPVCDGNKFQFLPSTAEAAPVEEPSETEVEDDDIFEAPVDTDVAEDSAQASARSTIVSEDELPKHNTESAPSIDAVDTPQEPTPDPSEVKAKLNEQFESIRILKPGQYELNLMELFDRDEYIVALEEDGRYVINVPSSQEDT